MIPSKFGLNTFKLTQMFPQKGENLYLIFTYELERLKSAFIKESYIKGR